MTASREDYLDLETDHTAPGTVSTSFRDPDGCLIVADNRALRVVYDESRHQVEEFLASDLFRELVSEGLLIKSWSVEGRVAEEQLGRLALSQNSKRLVVEHEFIDFPSYPFEWSPEMLHSAGELTLDLMERLEAQTFGLKDATPDNVLFRGPKPIFIDLLSIEQRDALDPTWLAYAQFVRTFIRPLLATKYFGIRLDQIFRVYRDGLHPEQVFRMSSTWQRLHPLFLTSVSLPALLSRFKP